MFKSYLNINIRSKEIEHKETKDILVAKQQNLIKRCLHKSEIGVNLSLLDKTANGEGPNMLVSRFNINYVGEEEEARMDEEEHPESESEPRDLSYRKLNKSEVSVRLSFLGKTANGEGYTYLKATLTGMNLTTIKAIQAFKHLQFVDLSSNRLELDELQAVTKLPYLVLLQADKNNLKSAALHKMKYFQVMIMNENEIASVHDIFQPELSTLELGFNKIEQIHFEKKMSNIKCLDFRNNLIKDIKDMDFPKLDSLYLAYNKITSLVGIEKLVNLRILHVRSNPIKSLDGFHENLTKLVYVNLRNCKVSTLKQIKKLRVLKGIETLILKGCPYMGGTSDEDADAIEDEDDPELRVEILAALARLKRINKSIVTPEEREEAKSMMLQWVEEGDKEDEEELENEIHLEVEQEEQDL